MSHIEFRSISQPQELWEIFLEESTGHISAFKDLLTEQEKIFSVEVSKKLGHRLHRLKGGLGFIGLTTISQKVGNCETLLNEKDADLFRTLKEILAELIELQSDLANLIRK